MASTRLLLALLLSLLACSALGDRSQQQSPYRLSRSQQCRLQKITTAQPSQRIESEGGFTELYDENEEQFQCAGVAPVRNTLRPNSLSLPNYHPNPRLVYIVQGQGLTGVSFPGCAETFHSQGQQEEEQGQGRGQRREEEQEQGRGQGQSRGDLHQKVHRIRKGDIIALPPGVAHWTYNDGNEDLIAVSVNDLNNQANQLDQKLRVYYLAGGVPRQGQQGRQTEQTFQNVLRGFDEEFLAEAFNVKKEVIRKMQKEDERGLIVKVRKGMKIIRPREEEEEGREERRGSNGLEEGICSAKIRHNIDSPRSSEVYDRDAGRMQIVNQHKLPILEAMDMSAEKGTLYPNALYTPHWAINGHSVVYVTRGEAQVEVVDHSGESVMNDRVNKGDLFVVPQYYVASFRAGGQGIEWVTIKTTSSPMRSPLAGYTSVFRGLPLQVIANAYQVSPSQAENLKYNSGRQTYLATPKRTSRS